MVQEFIASVGVYDDVGTVVPHTAGCSDLDCRTVYGWSEAHSLHGTPDYDPHHGGYGLWVDVTWHDPHHNGRDDYPDIFK